jgi:hypothetical protein
MAAPYVAALTTVLVLLVTGFLGRQVDRFVQHQQTTGDLRGRLVDPSNSGRIDQFDAALQGWHAQRLRGTGAGTYALTWYRERPTAYKVVDAHSLYFESLSELGIVGLALILAVVGALLAAAAARSRGPHRPLYGAIFAVVLAWALHAGVDWDWEMPAVTLPVLALGALALGDRARGLTVRPLGSNTRLAIGLAGLACMIAPFVVARSESSLRTAKSAFQAKDCRVATSAATDSLAWGAQRTDAYLVFGFCNLARGYPAKAMRALERAKRYDPNDWEVDAALTLAIAAEGRDPRPTIRRALARNPREPALLQMREGFASPASWNGAGVDRMWSVLINANILRITST